MIKPRDKAVKWVTVTLPFACGHEPGYETTVLPDDDLITNPVKISSSRCPTCQAELKQA